ncbi:MAG: hypothetical protein ACI30R_06365 [Sodaliphilus sp.]
MKKLLLLAFLACPMFAFAQNAYDYYGDKVQLEAHYFQSRNIGKLQGDKKQAYQGMDISEGYVASAQATGILTIYNLESELNKEKQIKLPNFGKTTNAFNISFGTTKSADDDVLPLLYISGNNGELNVAHFDKKFKNVEFIQSIKLSDAKAANVLWAIDRDNQFLYALTTGKNGQHQILRFAIPEIGSAEVKLNSNQALNSYVVEDYFKSKTITSIGGVYVHNGQLFITAGSATAADPSRLYVWDLYGKMMRNVIDLSTATRGVLKGCSIHDGTFYVQSAEGLYRLIF